jgi:manganese/zinc/iron transport system substrate-binding protein
MMTNTRSLFWIILLTALTLSACSTPAEQVDIADREIKVVTTIGMIADIAKNVGGDRVEVTGLMGPGIDPHLYKASEGDVSALLEADIIFYNGLHLEAQMGEVLERMENKTHAVTQGIDTTKLISPAEFQGNYDPHVWFNVTFWMQAVEAVRDALIEFDPGSESVYTANAEAYLAELEELHAYVQEQAQRLAESQRVIITAHDAFNYFGLEYGFEVRGLQGISTESEASTADVRGLVDFIVERQVKAVFIESSVPVRNVEAVQAAVQARGFDLEIGGELFSDAMGDPGTVEGTYVGMVRHNVDTIVEALLGE